MNENEQVEQLRNIIVVNNAVICRIKARLRNLSKSEVFNNTALYIALCNIINDMDPPKYERKQDAG